MRIGVIGTGYWGPNIVRNLLLLKQEVIIFDINRSRIESTLKSFPGCKRAGSLEDILTDKSIKATAIAVPLREHFDLINKSLQAGKHVYVEKAMCYSVAEAEKIQANLGDRILMVGHITLFTPAIVRIRELLQNGSTGRVTSVCLTRTHLGPIYQNLDAATEIASHDIAILLDLIPDIPQTVNAWGTSRLSGGYADSAILIIRYKGGLISTINVQWTSILRERKIIIEGTTGSIVCRTEDGKEEVLFYDQNNAFEALKKGAWPKEVMQHIKGVNLMPDDTEPLYTEMKAFLKCIENNETPMTDFEFGKKVVMVQEAVRRSMNQNGTTEMILW